MLGHFSRAQELHESHSPVSNRQILLLIGIVRFILTTYVIVNGDIEITGEVDDVGTKDHPAAESG
jgi:hypothetical protein